MSLKNETNAIGEKHANGVPAYEPAKLGDHARGRQFSIDPEDRAMVETDQNMLRRDLKGRHMQMIAM
jgi:amino acid permease